MPNRLDLCTSSPVQIRASVALSLRQILPGSARIRCGDRIGVTYPGSSSLNSLPPPCRRESCAALSSATRYDSTPTVIGEGDQQADTVEADFDTNNSTSHLSLVKTPKHTHATLFDDEGIFVRHNSTSQANHLHQDGEPISQSILSASNVSNCTNVLAKTVRPSSHLPNLDSEQYSAWIEDVIHVSSALSKPPRLKISHKDVEEKISRHFEFWFCEPFRTAYLLFLPRQIVASAIAIGTNFPEAI